MKRILGKTVLIHDLDRIKEMKTINKIVVATTDLEEDDIIVKAVKGYDGNIGTYRGSESDVLDRYYKAAKEFNADICIEILRPELIASKLHSAVSRRKRIKPNNLFHSKVKNYSEEEAPGIKWAFPDKIAMRKLHVFSKNTPGKCNKCQDQIPAEFNRET